MAGQLTLEPTSHHYESQRLKLHYVDWGNASRPLLVLVHGTRDHARSWDWVAQALHNDYHVIAPDLRGHGDSEWARGGTYSMMEYVLDLAHLLAQLDAFPVTLIGHSVGGGIALQYSGIYPANVSKIVAIEGLGPLHSIARQQKVSAHERVQEWVTFQRDLANRQPHRYKTLGTAVQRMHQVNPRLSQEQAHHLTLHGARHNEDSTYTWKYDPYIRRLDTYPFRTEETWDIWGRITCPTLLLGGTESGAALDKDSRVQAFRNAQVAVIPNAGHWVHHDQLDRFLKAVRIFLGL